MEVVWKQCPQISTRIKLCFRPSNSFPWSDAVLVIMARALIHETETMAYSMNFHNSDLPMLDTISMVPKGACKLVR